MAGQQSRQRFRELVLPHLDNALALARWLTGNRTDAEDVAQEAFLRALEAIDGFRGTSARAWIFAIVRNSAWTWLRRNHPASLVYVDDLAAVEAGQAGSAAGDGAANPEAALIAAQSGAQVQAAIAALAPAFREMIVLRDINGLSYREIGEVLGLPAGTVMSRLARARTQLMMALKDKEH